MTQETPYWLCCGSLDPHAHDKLCMEARVGHPERCRFGFEEDHSKWSKVKRNKKPDSVKMNFDEMCNPVLIIGEYRLTYSFSGDNTKIGITHVSGEGGDFNKAAFLKVLEDFYAKNM